MALSSRDLEPILQSRVLSSHYISDNETDL